MKEISILEEVKMLLEEEENLITPRLKLDVNPNPTKKGVKVQFILPKGYDDVKKEELTQKLKTKLNGGLAPHMLSVDVDTDVPYENVIGFLISISTIKMLIKSALEGKNDA